jgi:hypothetical protein
MAAKQLNCLSKNNPRPYFASSHKGYMRFTIITLVLLQLLQSSCMETDRLGRGRYKVVERTDEPNCSADHLDCTVKVVLLHDGHRLYATALDYKVDIGGEIRHCDLRVSDTISCIFFPDRNSRDAGGYNLICGNQLWNGKLTTTGGNELLTIYKDELQ